ncbi:MAG: hypothetical protein AW07_04697 [Candidatus Accumulibacter sp. SK-11]|nr:MAG: hypothetical protein AW07_04697 [Candidatus Accumulibacter sp. SK-11]
MVPLSKCWCSRDERTRGATSATPMTDSSATTPMTKAASSSELSS